MTGASGGSLVVVTTVAGVVIVSAAVSRWNARRPVAISKSTQPSEKMSDRWSAGCPRTCSGDM